MSILPTASAAKPARTTEAARVAWVYAGLLVVMAIAQLIGFSQFILVIDSYSLLGGLGFAAFLAGFLIAAELLALPFLLRLKLSHAFRTFSMALGLIVPASWFILVLHAMITTTTLTNIGFLGSSITLIPGWWALFISVALGILAIWASWGLWPFRRLKRAK